MCSFNWDKTIAEYNLSSSKPYETDIAYLLELSDDVLPSLYERKELMNRNFIIPRSSRGKQVFARDYFNMRVDFFINEQSNFSWLSWNLPDINVKEFFKNINYKNEN